MAARPSDEVAQPDSVGTSRGRHDQLEPFKIFLAEPILFLRLYRRGSDGRILLLLAPAYFLVLLVANAAAIRNGSGDMLNAWGYEACRLLTWSTRQRCGHWQPQPYFPLLHDLPSLLLMLILSVTPYVAYRMFYYIRDFIPQMVDHGVAKFEPEGAPEVERAIEAVNRYYPIAGGHGALWAAIAIFSTLFTTIGYGQLGMLQALAPAGLDTNGILSWRHAAYAHWWANSISHPAGWMAYVILGSIGGYYAIIMNVAGGPVLLFLWRTRKVIRYEANVNVVDGYYGYFQARQVMRYTYTAVVIHGIGFALLVFMMPAPLAVAYLIPLLTQWVTVLVADTYLPVMLLWRGIRRWKVRELNRIQRIIDSKLARSGQEESQQEAAIAPFRERADRVRRVRTFPFARARDIVFVGLSVLSAILTILGSLKVTGG